MLNQKHLPIVIRVLVLAAVLWALASTGLSPLLQHSNLAQAQTSSTRQVDVVFVMDTSGSMDDEFAVLCSRIPSIVQGLELRGIQVNYTVLGVTNQRDCTSGTVPTSVSHATVDNLEDWGPAIRDLAAGWQWNPGHTRLIIPISDEAPQDGNPCEDPGPDRDAVNEAILAAQRNNVRVVPILGTIQEPDQADCTRELFKALVVGFGTMYADSSVPSERLADYIYNLIGGVANDRDGDGIPDDQDKAPDDACQPDPQAVCLPQQMCGVSNTPHWDDDRDGQTDEEQEDGLDNDGDGLRDEDVGGRDCPFPDQDCGVNNHRSFDDDADGRVDEETDNGQDDDHDNYIDEDIACPCPARQQVGTNHTPGVDDDHDYFLDEEADDGLDNDGDGCVDEDVGEGIGQVAVVRGRAFERPGDGSSLPVPAVVQTGQFEAASDPDGVFELTLPAPGEYQILLAAEEYSPTLLYDLQLEPGDVMDVGDVYFIKAIYLEELERQIGRLERRYPRSQKEVQSFLNELRTEPSMDFEEEAVRRLLMVEHFVAPQEGIAKDLVDHIHHLFFVQVREVMDLIIAIKLDMLVGTQLDQLQDEYVRALLEYIFEITGNEVAGGLEEQLYRGLFTNEDKETQLEFISDPYYAAIDERLAAAVQFASNGAFHPGSIEQAKSDIRDLAWEQNHRVDNWRDKALHEEIAESWEEVGIDIIGGISVIAKLKNKLAGDVIHFAYVALMGIEGIYDVNQASEKADEILGRLYSSTGLPGYTTRAIQSCFDQSTPFSRTTRTKLKVRLHSPATLLVTDPFGRRVGGLSEVESVSEIPGAVYGGMDSEPQTVFVPILRDGEYTIELFGTGYGQCKLEIEQLVESMDESKSRVQTQTLEEYVVPGAQLATRVRVQSEEAIISVSQAAPLALASNSDKASAEASTGGSGGGSILLIVMVAVIMVGGAWFLGRHRSAVDAAVLYVSVGQLTGQTIRLSSTNLTVGRDSLNNLVLAEGLVSRTHAHIIRQGQEYYIEDLGSKTGTFVNHQKVTRATLSDGDEIGIGGTRLIFRRKT